ncbi:hypothetical protein ColKHC_07033 [Colletotrichum higginsianum]|nr:hypothetical protein ColKHC_07033 [Colletotrichum higginsianum]
MYPSLKASLVMTFEAAAAAASASSRSRNETLNNLAEVFAIVHKYTARGSNTFGPILVPESSLFLSNYQRAESLSEQHEPGNGAIVRQATFVDPDHVFLGRHCHPVTPKGDRTAA